MSNAPRPWQQIAHRINKLETNMLLLVAVITGGIFLFIQLGQAARIAEPHDVDERILLALRSPTDRSDPLGPEWIEEWVRDITALGGGGILLIITFGVVGYLFLRRNPTLAWLVLLAILGGFFLTTFLKAEYERPRPDLVPFETYVDSASFPSGHATTAAATYLTLGALLARFHTDRRLKIYVMILAVSLALGVGFSRVYLGVHWPTDVLAGWTIGAVWAAAWWTIVAWVQSRE